MIKKYGILGFSALALLVIGCDDSSSATNSPSESTFQKYSAEINELAKTIYITLPACIRVSDTETRYDPEGDSFTFEYELLGGTLILDDGHYPIEYAGNNSSLYGTWTKVDEECQLFGFCEIVKITSDSLIRYFDTSRLCAFDYLTVAMFSNMVGEGQDIQYNKTSCTSGSIDVDGKTLNVKVAKFNGTGMDMTLTLDGVKCRSYTNIKPLTPSLCSYEYAEFIEEDAVYESNYEEFSQCFSPLIQKEEDDEIFAKKMKSMAKFFSVK